MKQFLFAILTLSVMFAACTKEVTPSLSREDMLRKGKWRISSSKVTLTAPNGKPITVDYGAYRKKCIVDNVLRFDSLNKGAVLNGGTSCSIADADSIGFIWYLSNNQQSITLHNYYLMIDNVNQFLAYNGVDSVWEWKLDSAITSESNIVDAGLTDFSQSSFTINYSLPGVWLDTSGGMQVSPVIKPDTYNFQIKYSNF